MKNPVRLLTLLILVSLITNVSAASVIGTEVGETWIRWSWTNNSIMDIYVDGRLSASGNQFQYYYLTGLNPNEQHRLELRLNITNTSVFDSSIATTSTPQFFLYLLLVLGTVIGLVAVFLRNPLHQILTASLATVLCIGVGLVGFRTLPGLTVIGMILGAFAGIFVIWSFYKIYTHIQEDKFGDF